MQYYAIITPAICGIAAMIGRNIHNYRLLNKGLTKDSVYTITKERLLINKI